MSCQTHIVIRRAGFNDIILATSRWSGRQAPRAVQLALFASNCDPVEFLFELCRSATISGPRWVIGNRDVPVVTVEFDGPDGDTVFWDISESSPRVREKWKSKAYGWQVTDYLRGDPRDWALFKDVYGED